MVIKKKPVVSKSSSIVGKAKLAERVYNEKDKKQDLPKSQIEAVISDVLEEIKKSLIRKEEIRFPGYFTFKVVVSKPRMAMNLQTGKKMSIPAKPTPKIKFSIDLRERVVKGR